MGKTTTTIDYTYDPLYRLTAADYSTGDSYRYAYDAVGNRLQQETSVNGQQSTAAYQYDIANRLTNVDNVNYTWDANGNLLNDGASTYTYDPANRLAGVTQGSNTYTYAYNGSGDRLQQTVNGQTTNYTLDLNAGLTQVLDDGTNTYLYGVDRIAQVSGANTNYFLGDALNSVRQLTDASAAVTLVKAYDPYGNTITSGGNITSIYGYAAEQTDHTELIYLRARYYQAHTGRFFQRDPWSGDSKSPATFNKYPYGLNNPVVYTDPSGRNPLAFIVALAGVIGAGAALGGIYGCFSYEWAITGRCGCDIQHKAFSMSKADWVGMNALMGGFTAGILSLATAAAVINPAAAVVVGGTAATYAVWDGINLLKVVYQEGVGWTLCNIIRGMLDLSAAIFGTSNMIAGIRGYLASGSWMEWSNGSTSGSGVALTRGVVIDELDQVAGRYIPKLIEISGEDSAIGFRGSLARGTVGNPGKITFGQPVDLNNFDIDAFIVSDELASEYPGGGYRHGGDIPEIQVIQDNIDSTLRDLPEFKGLRADEPFEFRIWTRQEALERFDGHEIFWYGDVSK